MPRPRHPEEAHHSPRHPPRRSPRTPRTPRTPITPAKSPRYEHRDRRRPLSEDLDDETEAHFSPTPVRAHDRFQRLSRMLVQPWGHHIPAPPPPMPPFPPPARPRQPPPKRDRLKEANQHIVWAKAFAMLLSGAACLCFILAFCFDEVMDVKLPGFTSGEDHTGATTITLAFGDRSTLPPGSPISGWHQEGFFFVIRFSSVFAGVSSLLAVLFIAQGKRIRKMAPSLLAEPFLGVADRLHPVQYKRTPYGTAYIKLWSYGFAILLPTAALVLILRALSSTAGYVSGLSDIGNSSKTSLAMSGILNIVGFVSYSFAMFEPCTQRM